MRSKIVDLHFVAEVGAFLLGRASANSGRQHHFQAKPSVALPSPSTLPAGGQPQGGMVGFTVPREPGPSWARVHMLRDTFFRTRREQFAPTSTVGIADASLCSRLHGSESGEMAAPLEG